MKVIQEYVLFITLMFVLIIFMISILYVIVGQDNIFLISVVSSIIGGIVSGGLTLSGVYLTIKNQHRKEFIESYSKKIRFANDILMDCTNIYRLCNMHQKSNSYTDKITLMEEVINRREEYFDKAVEVNENMYEVVNNFMFELNNWYHDLYNYQACVEQFGTEECRQILKNHESAIYKMCIDIELTRTQLQDEYRKHVK